MKFESESSISETKIILKQRRVLQRIQESALYQSYRETFEKVTGLPLELHPISEGRMSACRGSVNQNRFCSLLNKGEEGCRQCLMAQRCLASTRNFGVQSIACFAGLQETAVPVRLGCVTVAQLKTGQIFHEHPSLRDWRELGESLSKEVQVRADLEEAFMATPVIEKQKYQAMVTLLAAFSLQLTKLANQIERRLEHEEEDTFQLAKDYIEEHLTDRIYLDDVAGVMKMSSFHFCRSFKTATGMTLTKYVIDCRIEFAKEALVDTEHRITDIAYDAGFQSLSQFNRSFRKAAGMSPTQFRERRMAA
ncbi:helix-turn-helix domain-containing protein (plasmid) [Verrucomicrobiaceae bacterium 227]